MMFSICASYKKTNNSRLVCRWIQIRQRGSISTVNYSVLFKLRLFFGQTKRASGKTLNFEFIHTLHLINNGRVLHTLPEIHNVAQLLFRVVIKEGKGTTIYAPNEPCLRCYITDNYILPKLNYLTLPNLLINENCTQFFTMHFKKDMLVG